MSDNGAVTFEAKPAVLEAWHPTIYVLDESTEAGPLEVEMLNWHVDTIHYESGAKPSSASIKVVKTSDPTDLSTDFVDDYPLFTKIRIVFQWWEDDVWVGDHIIFEGRITNIQGNERNQDAEIIIHCQGSLFEVLGKVVTGQHWDSGYPTSTHITLPCVFNPGNTPDQQEGDDTDRYGNYTAGVALYEAAFGVYYRSFFTTPKPKSTDDDYSRFWTAATAAEYLVNRGGFYEHMIAPDHEEYAILGSDPMPQVNIEGKNYAEALEMVLETVGYNYAIYNTISGPRLMFFSRRGEYCNEKTLFLQDTNEALEAGLSNVNRLEFNRDGGKMINKVVAYGALEEYEDEFTLEPDWDATLEDATNQKYFRKGPDGDTEEYAKRRNVYRRYSLKEWDDESSGYSALTTLFGSGPSGHGDNLVPRKRVFLKCFARDADEGRLAPILRNWTGSAWVTIDKEWKVLDDRCGIIFHGAEPPMYGEYNSLRITAVVQSDARLRVELGPRDTTYSDEVDVERTIEFPNNAWHYVDTSSLYYQALSESTSLVEDDTDDLTTKATNYLAREEKTALSTSVGIPWLDSDYTPSDIITGVEGRDISFDLGGGTYPQVVGINYDFTNQEMELVLSDMRLEEII